MPRPNLRRGLAYGAAMAVLFVALWAVAAAVLDIGGGLLIIAAVAGWLIGTAVALGAEPGSLRRGQRTVRLAVAVSLTTWAAGTFAAYLLSLAILQGSALPFLARIGGTPFLDFIAPEFLPSGPLELGALALFGWLGAR
jgi:hypothetical protein